MGISFGFSLNPISLPLDSILSSKTIPADLHGTRKFHQIRSSIEEIGLIEPLSVTPVIGNSERYMLLDGHLRFIILRDMGNTAVPCLIALDDEGYTYNNRINRLSTIQEHHMIRRAIERGVSPERLAKALSVNVSQISKKKHLLDGICPEAVEMLKDRQFSAEIARILRKMKPMRQIECVELMIAANTLTVAYAEAMLVATPADLLVESKKTFKLSGVAPEQVAKMEREMANLQGQYKMVEQTYGQDVLNLVLAKGYLTKLLDNKAIARYLRQRQPEILAEFELIIKTTTLEQ